MIIPIFIIVHNQYEILKKVVSSYEKYIKTPIEIIFHDVASFYFETLDYLSDKEQQGYKVYRSKINNHHTVINSVKSYLSNNPKCEYVIITDPDIEFCNVPENVLDLYIYALNKLNKTSVGPMLEIHDIPDNYHNKESVIRGHTNQFWSKPRKEILFNENTYQYIDCMTDTTFQLFRANRIPASFPHNNSLRFLSPYSAKHLDWYITPNNITPCSLFCYFTSSNISHWNSKTFNGSYHGTSLKRLSDNFNVNYNYYYSEGLSRIKPYFGDVITSFIYEKLINKKPILDIDGGKNNDNVIFGSGSILGNVKNNSIVWGSGLFSGNEEITKPKNILSVRGLLTRKRILNSGYECPEIYGDIGLILPYFYYPQLTKVHKLGIILEPSDKDIFNQIYKDYGKDIVIIDILSPLHTVIESILKCQFIISSYLEGIIVSHAYNVKCMWIKVSNELEGGCFRFHDYYSTFAKNYEKIEPYYLNKVLPTNDLITLTDNFPNPIFPINTKHIIKLMPFINI